MGITFRILDEGRGLEFINEGIIYGSDIIEAMRQAHTPEVVSNLKYKIVDLSDVEENYTSVDELREIAAFDSDIAAQNPALLTALITPDTSIEMVVDLWHSYLGQNRKNIRYFHSRKDASEWLDTRLQRT